MDKYILVNKNVVNGSVPKFKKGCLNNNCQQHHNKKIFPYEFSYCPFCSDSLQVVCADCYTPIDISLNSKYCQDCFTIREERKEKLKEDAKIAGKFALRVASKQVFGPSPIISLAKDIINKDK